MSTFQLKTQDNNAIHKQLKGISKLLKQRTHIVARLEHEKRFLNTIWRAAVLEAQKNGEFPADWEEWGNELFMSHLFNTRFTIDSSGVVYMPGGLTGISGDSECGKAGNTGLQG